MVVFGEEGDIQVLLARYCSSDQQEHLFLNNGWARAAKVMRVSVAEVPRVGTWSRNLGGLLHSQLTTTGRYVEGVPRREANDDRGMPSI
jgi:hypothetical protein